MRSDAEHGLGLVLSVGVIVAMAAGPAWAQSIDPEVMESVKRATVMVKTSHSKTTKGDTPLGSGTGFFVNATGLCITNDHVTDPAHGKTAREKFEASIEFNRLTWRVVVDSGTDDEQTYEANVLYSNDQADMAVMQVRDEDGEFLSTPDFLLFHSTEELALKSKLWNLGFPGGKNRGSSRDANPEIAIQTGNVVDLPRSPSGRVKGIVTNVLANQGNSGGPAVDQDGRLVGIVTLGGSGDTSVSAYSVLIPADLTHQMIRIAFEERKIPGGVDITPFFDLLMDDAGIYRIPEMERSATATCVTMEEGAVLCGSPSDATISWPGPLGEIAIPSGLFAYYITDSEDDEYGRVLLDGGDRFWIVREDVVFKFTPRGGSPMDIDIEEVQSIAFRLPSEAPPPPEGNAFVISGEGFRLSIKNPKGKIKFTTTSDLSVDIPVGDLAAVETDDDDQKWLHTIYGSKMGGSFAEHELTGVLAWSDTPVSFSFDSEYLSDAGVRTVNYALAAHHGEPSLAESISTSDSRLVKIAASLDAGSIGSEKSTLDELLEPDTYKRLSPKKKEEVKRLEGEHLFRDGQFDSAAAVFKKLRNADLDDVRWHARTRLAMIERFDGGMFGGVKLSDHKAFDAAAETLAEEQIREARRSLEELEAAVRSEPPKRTEYLKLARRAKGVEDSLLIANRLSGGATEELMVRLWRNLSYLHANEARRLEEEAKELQEESRGRRDSRRRTDSQRRRIERKLARFETDIEKAREAFAALRIKIRGAGFIIDDAFRDIFEKN